MSYLCDRSIRKLCIPPTFREYYDNDGTIGISYEQYLDAFKPLISPFHEEQLQPASYDIRLGEGFKVTHHQGPPYLNVIDLGGGDVPVYYDAETRDDGSFHLYPGEGVLGCTAEFVHVPDYLVSEVGGKSKLGRCFLAIHVTAGFVDPKWRGRLTLEIVNLSKAIYVLRPGMPIGQLIFGTLDEPCEKGYGERGNHYQDSEKVRAPV